MIYKYPSTYNNWISDIESWFYVSDSSYQPSGGNHDPPLLKADMEKAERNEIKELC